MPTNMTILRRELRAPVATRVTDDRLRQLAWDSGIRLWCVGENRWQASAVLVTQQATVNAHLEIVRPVRQETRALALATDRTARSALRRLLDTAPEACRQASLAGITVLPNLTA